MNLEQIIKDYQQRLQAVREQLSRLMQTEQQLIGALSLATQLHQMEQAPEQKPGPFIGANE